MNNASRQERSARGVLITSTRSPAKVSPTRLKSFRRSRKACPAALTVTRAYFVLTKWVRVGDCPKRSNANVNAKTVNVGTRQTEQSTSFVCVLSLNFSCCNCIVALFDSFSCTLGSYASAGIPVTNTVPPRNLKVFSKPNLSSKLSVSGANTNRPIPAADVSIPVANGFLLQKYFETIKKFDIRTQQIPNPTNKL